MDAPITWVVHLGIVQLHQEMVALFGSQQGKIGNASVRIGYDPFQQGPVIPQPAFDGVSIKKIAIVIALDDQPPL
jgi:hypothetical protein